MPTPKQIGIWVATILVAVAVGYGGGRFSRPSKVVETTKDTIKDVVQEKTVAQEQTKQQVERKTDLQLEKSESKVEQKHIKKNIKETILPDGTKTIVDTSTEDDGTDEQEQEKVAKETKTEEVKQLDFVLHDDRVEQKDETHEKRTETTYDKPEWRVSVLAGLDLGSLARNGLSLHLNDTKLVFGAQVEKRLFWTVAAGVWGLNSGQGGLSLSVQF